MSYCSLEEAWGTPSLQKCSRVSNSSGVRNGVNYTVSNQSPCGNNNNRQNINNELSDNKRMNNINSRSNNNKRNRVNYNLINNDNNSIKPVSSTFNEYSFLDANLDDGSNLYSEVPQNGNQNNVPQMEEQNLSLINSENNENNAPKPLNPFNDNHAVFNGLNDDDIDDDDDDDNNNDVNDVVETNNEIVNDDVYVNNRNNKVFNNLNVNVESEEGFQNNNLNLNANSLSNGNNSELTQKMLINILDRLDEIEKKINTSKNQKSNVHDIILFIIIGIFVLFALDSVFRIGRSTV